MPQESICTTWSRQSDRAERRRRRAREDYLKKRSERLASRSPDPIDLLPGETLAYLAGLIDGEGSLYIAAVGPKRKKTCYPIITIAMTHRGVIDWVARTLGKSSVKLNNHTRLRRNPEKWRPQWKYQLFGKRAQLLCRKLLPYLKVKDEQARIILEFPSDLRTAPGVRIDEEVNAIRYELRRRMRELNRRGPRQEEVG